MAILNEAQWKSDWPIMRENYCSIISNVSYLANIRCNTQSGAGIMLQIVRNVSTRMILTYVYLSFTITRKIEWKPSIYKDYLHKWCPTYFFVYKGSSFDRLTIRIGRLTMTTHCPHSSGWYPRITKNPRPFGCARRTGQPYEQNWCR